jgi:hypothetical protein
MKGGLRGDSQLGDNILPPANLRGNMNPLFGANGAREISNHQSRA